MQSPAGNDAAATAESGRAEGTESDSDNQIISKSFAAITSIFGNFKLPHTTEAPHPTPLPRHLLAKGKRDAKLQSQAADLAAAAAAVAIKKRDQVSTTISRLVIGGTIVRRPSVIPFLSRSVTF